MSIRTTCASWMVAAGLLAATLGCANRSRSPDIFLITVDTLRADHVGALGYARQTTPRLDELFSEGVIFERAYATQASTGPSVASMLTGQRPQEHGVRGNVQMLPADVDTVEDLARWS